MKVEDANGQPDMKDYTCMDDFRHDIKLIFDNARTYNSKETIFYKYAQQLEALIKPMLNRLRDVNAVPVTIVPMIPQNPEQQTQIMQANQ